jgi:hypothetical protein
VFFIPKKKEGGGGRQTNEEKGVTEAKQVEKK